MTQRFDIGRRLRWGWPPSRIAWSLRWDESVTFYHDCAHKMQTDSNTDNWVARVGHMMLLDRLSWSEVIIWPHQRWTLNVKALERRWHRHDGSFRAAYIYMHRAIISSKNSIKLSNTQRYSVQIIRHQRLQPLNFWSSELYLPSIF